MPYLGGYQKLARLAGAKSGIGESRMDLSLQEFIGISLFLAYLVAVFISDPPNPRDAAYPFVTYALFIGVPTYFVSDLPRFCRWCIATVTLAAAALGILLIFDFEGSGFLWPFVVACVLILVRIAAQLIVIRRTT